MYCISTLCVKCCRYSWHRKRDARFLCLLTVYFMFSRTEDLASLQHDTHSASYINSSSTMVYGHLGKVTPQTNPEKIVYRLKRTLCHFLIICCEIGEYSVQIRNERITKCIYFLYCINAGSISIWSHGSNSNAKFFHCCWRSKC